MSATKDFKVKTIIQPHQFPVAEGFHGIAIDLGYSGVKAFGPQGYICFPAYARKQQDEAIRLNTPSKSDIMYRDKDGIWTVGELAYQEMSFGEVSDSEKELYGRMRYYTPSFLVLARTGLAMLLNPGSAGCAGGKAIAVQTGLPPKYLKEDSKYIIEVLSGTHEFELCVGDSGWKSYKFYIDAHNILPPMAQPMGAMISISVNNAGNMVPETERYLNSNVIVLDPGFGTLDDFSIINGRVQGNGETFPELGMREVFNRTCKDIQEEYGIKLEIPQLQSALEKGEVWVTDIRKMTRTAVGFKDLLNKNSKAVCAEALNKLKIVHNYFQDTDYIIGTGGTYDAWRTDIDTAFSGMQGLRIIPGNVNAPDIPNVFSNARGYYYYLINQLNARM